MESSLGTSKRRPARDHLENALAPGNHGIVARTLTSQSSASRANCCRLKGAERGSTRFGKIFVRISTRMVSIRYTAAPHSIRKEQARGVPAALPVARAAMLPSRGPRALRGEGRAASPKPEGGGRREEGTVQT